VFGSEGPFQSSYDVRSLVDSQQIRGATATHEGGGGVLVGLAITDDIGVEFVVTGDLNGMCGCVQRPFVFTRGI